MTFNFLGPGLTVNVEAKVKEQIILDSSGEFQLLLKECTIEAEYGFCNSKFQAVSVVIERMYD